MADWWVCDSCGFETNSPKQAAKHEDSTGHETRGDQVASDAPD